MITLDPMNWSWQVQLQLLSLVHNESSILVRHIIHCKIGCNNENQLISLGGSDDGVHCIVQQQQQQQQQTKTKSFPYMHNHYMYFVSEFLVAVKIL